MPDPLPKHRLLSLYSGAGGLDQGFEQTARFESIVCVEMQIQFATTLRDNRSRGFLPNVVVLQESVSDLKPDAVIEEHFGGDKPDGIIGGPPCQSYSVRGKRLGLKDSRSDETFRFMEWVAAIQPRFFLMENVPRMLKLEEGAIRKRIYELGSLAGYSMAHSVLNAADYGSATRRRRAFIVGLLGPEPFTFPSATHAAVGADVEGLADHVSSGSALAGLPAPGFIKPGSPQGHLGIRHTPPVIKRFDQLAPGQQDNVRKRTRLDATKPSPTLVAGNLHEIRSHIHPTEPRELTNRESARLHGFDDRFTFDGNHAAMGKQVANSVPIPLAKALATQIASTLDLAH